LKFENNDKSKYFTIALWHAVDIPEQLIAYLPDGNDVGRSGGDAMDVSGQQMKTPYI